MAHPQTLATQVETLRVNLLSMSDSLRSIRTALQIPLVTVMGRQEVLGAGLLKAAARKKTAVEKCDFFDGDWGDSQARSEDEISLSGGGAGSTPVTGPPMPASDSHRPAH